MPAIRYAHVPVPSPAVPLEILLKELDPDMAEAMLRECLAEAALRRHLQRVHESRYASEDPQPRELFHIG